MSVLGSIFIEKWFCFLILNIGNVYSVRGIAGRRCFFFFSIYLWIGFVQRFQLLTRLHLWLERKNREHCQELVVDYCPWVAAKQENLYGSSAIVRNFTDLSFPVVGEVIFSMWSPKYPEYNAHTNCQPNNIFGSIVVHKNMKYRLLFLRSKYMEMKYVPEIFLSIRDSNRGGN